eukprot:gene52186-9978_t
MRHTACSSLTVPHTCVHDLRCPAGHGKGVFADFFPDDKEAAGANQVFQNGVASTIAFYVFPHMGSRAQAGVCVASAVWA